MRSITRVLPFLSLLVLYPVPSAAQTPARDTSASISGRVTVGGKGAGGITVVASIGNSYFDIKTVAKTATDTDGNYRLTGLTTGQFTIMPIAKAFVAGTGSAFKEPRQSVNLAAGESITKINFTLVRGGIITGRITDAQGNPLIGEPVSLEGSSDSPQPMHIANNTDDRGIYRIYGLRPGSYTLSVGQASSAGGVAGILGMGGSQYAKTFYPGVPEKSKATTIEVTEGAEVTGIDITPGKSAEGFSASGRVLDADSGKPVPNAFIGYSSSTDTNQQMSGMNFGGQTDADGKFRLEGMRPGRYAAFTLGMGQDNVSYSDPTPFDISEGDVTGIEIKVRLGGTIEGVAVIENNPDPAVSTLLQTVQLYAFVQSKGPAAPSFGRGQINRDGTFRFAGLAPGKARIGIQGFPTAPKGLTLVRTELDGLEQTEGIELSAGAQVSGVRLVFVYGTGSIRGEVKIEGGVLPEGTAFHLSMHSGTGEIGRMNPGIQVDARGQFVSENIPPGTYELTLRGVNPDPKLASPFEPVKQTVTVAHSGEVRVIFVVDLAARKAGPQ